MKISDPDMLRKMDRALAMSGNLYDLADIIEGLKKGELQGHVEGDTWVITQVHDWPQRRSVNILYLVGSMENSLKIEAKIEKWAKDLGADLLRAVGRDGWWEHRTPGWKKIGTLYSKDI